VYPFLDIFGYEIFGYYLSIEKYTIKNDTIESLHFKLSSYLSMHTICLLLRLARRLKESLKAVAWLWIESLASTLMLSSSCWPLIGQSK